MQQVARNNNSSFFLLNQISLAEARLKRKIKCLYNVVREIIEKNPELESHIQSYKPKSET